VSPVTTLATFVAAKSQIAGQACALISQLYDIESEIKALKPDGRLKIRLARSKPLADKFHAWMLLQRRQVTDGTATATAKALDYSLKRWAALTQFLDNAQLPIDNNWIENQIRPIAIGRNNATSSLMRTRLRRRAIPSSIEAPPASLPLRMITAIAGTASTPWAGGSELP